MINYKYEHIENVIVKKDFKVYKYDEFGELVETKLIKKGTKGTLESMGFNYSYDDEPHYDFAFYQDEDEIETHLYESKIEELLEIVKIEYRVNGVI